MQFQFGLRRLIISVTVVAMVFAWSATRGHEVELRMAAIAAALALGGLVLVSKPPDVLRVLLPTVGSLVLAGLATRGAGYRSPAALYYVCAAAAIGWLAGCLLSRELVRARTEAASGEPARRRIWSIGIAAVAINLGIWELGVFFNYFGGTIDEVGAGLCIATYHLAPLLVVLTLLYALIRRYLLPIHQWDLYGPLCAVMACILINAQAF